MNNERIVFLPFIFFSLLFRPKKNTVFWSEHCIQKGAPHCPSMSLLSSMFFIVFFYFRDTLQETNISPKNGILKIIFLFPRWDMLIPWRVIVSSTLHCVQIAFFFHFGLRSKAFFRNLPSTGKFETYFCLQPGTLQKKRR